MPTDSLVIESSASGVSWGAIIAGAVAAAALSFVLLLLGVGLGLSAVSPWSGQGASASAVGVSTVLWVALTQIAASGLGGYLAGRLRVRWSSVHTDEVYFRDTAHGLVAWALSTLVMAGLMGSAITGVLGTATQAASNVVSQADSLGYWSDNLLRSDRVTGVAGNAANAANAASTAMAASAPVAGMESDMSGNATTATTTNTGNTATPNANVQNDAVTTVQVGRVLSHALSAGSLSPADTRYLGSVVAQRTGRSQADAERKVTETFAQAKKFMDDASATAKLKAEEARRVAAKSALWGFVALLAGAFFSAWMATHGGIRRDAVTVATRPV